MTLLLDLDSELRPAPIFLHTTHVATTLVGESHAPVETGDFVAYRVDGVAGVECQELVRQELAQVVKDQAADTHGLLSVGLLHYAVEVKRDDKLDSISYSNNEI